MRRIFERYLALGSVHRLKAELDAAGIRTPERRHRNGSCSGGAAFSRGKLYALLANPLFIGRIRHHEEVHPGQHPAIVDEALWQAVQDRLAANRQTPQQAGRGGEAEPAGRPALRSRRPEDAAEPCPQEGPALSLLRQHRSRRRQRRHRRQRLAHSRGRDRGRGRSAVAARLREPGFLSEVLSCSQSAPEAAPRLIARISELATSLALAAARVPGSRSG